MNHPPHFSSDCPHVSNITLDGGAHKAEPPASFRGQFCVGFSAPVLARPLRVSPPASSYRIPSIRPATGTAPGEGGAGHRGSLYKHPLHKTRNRRRSRASRLSRAFPTKPQTPWFPPKTSSSAVAERRESPALKIRVEAPLSTRLRSLGG